MPQLPTALLDSLEGVTGFDRSAFEAVHEAGTKVTSIRVNPLKTGFPTTGHSPVPWSQWGHYLDQRPSFTFDPLFHAGCYYVQEASSMFLEQAFRQAVSSDTSLRVLDLCGAPGGKSTHLQSLLTTDSLLVSNEVIKTRATVLKQNLVKWGGGNVVISNNDPKQLGRLEGFFDVIVADAPCSGSGLFRRDPDAIEEWSLSAVQLCHDRQQRILADVLPALREGGVLIYSTCSYSVAEDEAILDWLLSEQGLEAVSLQVPTEWSIVESHTPAGGIGYRFYPDKTKGEGFFLTVVRKSGSPQVRRWKSGSVTRATAKEKEGLTHWITLAGQEVLKQGETLYAFPSSLVPDLAVLQAHLYLLAAGTAIGEWMRTKLVPDHALAMSPLAAAGIPRQPLTEAEAVTYLQRQDLRLDTAVKGWQLVTYEGHPLGWINALPNRINNYYPKELRILKLQNDTPYENK